jgi:hypothetical protein
LAPSVLAPSRRKAFVPKVLSILIELFRFVVGVAISRSALAWTLWFFTKEKHDI